MIIQVCVGSSCHIKGSQEIVSLFKNAIHDHGLEGEITLAGSFCLNKCRTTGVSVKINDDVLCVTRDSFNAFFQKEVLKRL